MDDFDVLNEYGARRMLAAIGKRCRAFAGNFHSQSEYKSEFSAIADEIREALRAGKESPEDHPGPSTQRT